MYALTSRSIVVTSSLMRTENKKTSLRWRGFPLTEIGTLKTADHQQVR